MNKRMQELIDLNVRKSMLEKRLEEEVEDIKEAETDEELDEATRNAEDVKAQLESIKEQIASIEAQLNETEEANKEFMEEEEGRKIMSNKVETRKVVIETPEERAQKIKERETRAAALKEGRSVTVAASDVLLPKHDPETLQTYPFRPVSNIVDLVKTIPLKGGESYEKAFVKDYGVAGTTLEGEDYAETEPTWGYAQMSKVKITAYTEVTEEVLKLPSLDYEAEVLKNVDIALKKKFAQQITLGAGTTNTFKGIFANGVEALTEGDDLPIAAINDKTLDEIIFSYGGDEEVSSLPAVLMLNKLDLKAFATLRNSDGTKTHNVDYKNQTIDGIPYVINSNCPALSASTTQADTYCMAYGVLDGYEVPVFSDVEIMKSTDYKFKQGIVCYKASVFAGGNVGSFRAFVRVKKLASA